MGINYPVYLFSKTPFAGVIHIPIIQTLYYRVTINIAQYDLIVLTSKEALNALEYNRIEWQSVDVIAVSDVTAKYVDSKGGHVAACANGYGESLYDVIMKNYTDRRIVFPSARVLAGDFARRLQDAGVAIEIVTIYETRCSDCLGINTIEEDAVLAFSSPSGVACFMKYFKFLPTHKIAVIGTTTARALPADVTSNIAVSPSIKSLVALAQKLAVSDL